MQQLLPVFERLGTQGEGIGAFRLEGIAAMSNATTHTTGTKLHSELIAKTTVIRQNEPGFFHWCFDQRRCHDDGRDPWLARHETDETFAAL